MELGLFFSEEGIAEFGEAFGACGACALECGLLTGCGDFVVGEVEAPLVVVIEVVGRSSEGNLDDRPAALEDDTAMAIVTSAGSGGEEDRAAYVESGPGEGCPVRFGELEEGVSAKAGVFVDDDQTYEGDARALGVGGGESGGELGRLLGFSVAFQLKEAGEFGEVVFAASGGSGVVGPDAYASLAELLAVEGFGEPALPAFGYFDGGFIAA